MTRFGITNSTGIGKLDLDSQNGTISNCVLEIPQNVKLTLENNVLTLKSGTIGIIPSLTYIESTNSSDKTYTIPNTLNDGIYVIFTARNFNIQTPQALSKIQSGTEIPTEAGNYRFFNVTDRKIYTYDSTNLWHEWSVFYPFCLIEMKSGIASFAKDSNGNDMIFNGACFVGHHAVVYPNVSVLMGNNFNNGGSLNSVAKTTNTLTIVELSGTAPTGYTRGLNFAENNYIGQFSYREIDDLSELDGTNYYSYVKNQNQIYTGTGVAVVRIALAYFTLSGSTVTDFTIRQPVRMATVEMLSSGLAEKADQSTTYTKTEVDSSLALKANASEVVTLSGNYQSISGIKYFTSGQARLYNYNISYTDETKSQNGQNYINFWASETQTGYINSYLRSATQVSTSIAAYYGIGTINTAELRVTAYADGTKSSTIFEPTDNTTTSKQIDTVGARNTELNTRLQLVSVMPVSPNSKTIYFVTTGQIYYGNTLIVDNSLESITGYDATATQTLKNVNGTLTWVTDV